ncbi:MAG: FmdB family transcriptional regulator [Streptosporangiaceae bacterium]|nr:FmdB family transcriptional regulator [Streptosporangiaceae bacterium]
MPTYQYTCTDCGEQVEAVQKFTDAPLSTCAACGGRLRKVFSPVGIVFKGSGFYRTDSRNGSAPAPAKDKDKAASEATASGASGSGESSDKPAAGKTAEGAGTSSKVSSGEKAA